MKRHVFSDNNNYSIRYSLDTIILDILYLIHKYLDSRSYLSLKCTSKHFYNVAETEKGKQLYSEIEKLEKLLCYIRSYLEDKTILDECKNFLAKTNSVIAGGLLLMGLKNEIWHRVNINIFIPKQSDDDDDLLKDNEESLYAKRYNLVRNAFQAYYFISHQNGRYISDKNIANGSQYMQTYIDSDYDFTDDYNHYYNDYEHDYSPLIKLKFIFTNCIDVKEYIHLHFDLSCCKIYTDLEQVYCYDYDQHVASITFIHNALNYTPQKLAKRIKKYKEHGIKVLECSEADFNINEYTKRMKRERDEMYKLAMLAYYEPEYEELEKFNSESEI